MPPRKRNSCPGATPEVNMEELATALANCSSKITLDTIAKQSYISSLKLSRFDGSYDITLLLDEIDRSIDATKSKDPAYLKRLLSVILMGQLNSLLIYSNQKKKTATTTSGKPLKSVLPPPDIRNYKKRRLYTNWNRNLTRLWPHLCCSFKPRPGVLDWARRTSCLSLFRVCNPRSETI